MITECCTRELLCGANDGCLYVYDREVNKQTSRIPAHHGDVNAVSFVDDTTHVLVSGGDDGVCMVWDRRALRERIAIERQQLVRLYMSKAYHQGCEVTYVF